MFPPWHSVGPHNHGAHRPSPNVLHRGTPQLIGTGKGMVVVLVIVGDVTVMGRKMMGMGMSIKKNTSQRMLINKIKLSLFQYTTDHEKSKGFQVQSQLRN